MSSGPTDSSLNLGPPPRWLRCPRKGQIIENKFLPFKAPLCSAYDPQVPEQYRFPPKMLFSFLTSGKHQIGLWIDLTKTERFYASSEVELEGARYVKLQCSGHDESPTPDNVNSFVEICKDFWRQPGNRGKLVAVHCTHGFNRTGFLISAFLHLSADWDIGAAIKTFAAAREPGIYKQGYLDDLVQRYGFEGDPVPPAPPMPDWSSEDANHLDGDEAAMADATPAKNVPFFDGHVPAVVLVADVAKRVRLQKYLGAICKWNKGFPGGQPVSMDQQNIKFLADKPYKVSWKADGVRYMMLIEGKDQVYMFDRDNMPYEVKNLTFYHRTDGRHIKLTLLDGEMVLDIVDGKKIPRYLIYDIVLFEDQSIGGEDFNARLKCIQKELIRPREAAKKEGRIDPRAEPFSVRAKDFWDINVAAVKKLMSPSFPTAHERDGLVFQPASEPYYCGRTDDVLKWKPPHLNSVDFRLRVHKSAAPGMLPEWKGDLMVLHLDTPFAQMTKLTKELKAMDGKIIECTYDKEKGWTYMRERVDKSFPNAFNTAKGVCESISKPVTEEYLLMVIQKLDELREREARQFQRSGMRPPNGPPMKRPHPSSSHPPSTHQSSSQSHPTQPPSGTDLPRQPPPAYVPPPVKPS